MIVAIVFLAALMFGALRMLSSRGARARARAQLIADFTAALVREHAADTNVVYLESYRLRRLATAGGHAVAQPQHATR